MMTDFEQDNLDSNFQIVIGYGDREAELTGVTNLINHVYTVNQIGIEIKGIVLTTDAYKLLDEAFNAKDFIRVQVIQRNKNVAGNLAGNFKFISFDTKSSTGDLSTYTCKLLQLSSSNRINPLKVIQQLTEQMVKPGDINHWKILFITTEKMVVQGWTLEDYCERFNLTLSEAEDIKEMNIRYQEELKQIDKFLQPEISP